MNQRQSSFWQDTKALLVDAMKTTKQGGSRVILFVFALHLMVLLLLLPALRWLFNEALRASGLAGVDLNQLEVGPGIGVTLTLLFVIVIISFWVLTLQLSVLSVLVYRARLGLPITVKETIKALTPIFKKLLRPSALSLLGYLFVVIPLTGFGFLSTVVESITLPSFISGEIVKTIPGAILITAFFTLMSLLNLIWALTIPLFTLTKAKGGQSLRTSAKLMFGRGFFQIPIITALILLAATVLTAAIVLLTLSPVWITDQVAPDASPIAAAIGLGIAETLGGLLTAFVTTLIMATLVNFMLRNEDRLPKNFGFYANDFGYVANHNGRYFKVLTALALALTVALSFFSYAPILALSKNPESLVIGHRGFSEQGAENTIEGLDAAAAAKADMVEIDVMQTKDGKFVVMHDGNLLRLTGIFGELKDFTYDELTEMTITAQYGHTGMLPSLEQYVTHAKEIDMPLLIEIKLSGAETPDHIDLLVEELEELDALTNNIYHSLDPASVERLKELRPDLYVGYTMAFAGVNVPDTHADFIVVEEWTATEKVQQEAHDAGLGFMVWTVNGSEGIREHLRRASDGIITDHPDVAFAERESMQKERGLVPVMWDALDRFVTVF